MKSVIVWIKEFIDEISKMSIGAHAGNTAFFFLLSMIPILVLFSMALPLIGISRTDFINYVVNVTPSAADNYVISIVGEAYSLSGKVLPMTLIALVWSCARGMLGLMYGLNDVYHIKDDRGYFYLRFLATVYMILLIVLLLVMLVLMVFGQSIQSLIQIYLPHVHTIFDTLLHFRYLIVVAGGILVLSLIFKLVPAENQPFIEQVPGAAFTVVAWIVFSKIFSLFSSVPQYSAFYGSLAVLIIFMFWLYWCVYLILVGGYINWYFRYVFRIWLLRFKQNHPKEP